MCKSVIERFERVYAGDRNYRLPQGLEGAYPPVDVLELCIAVSMLGAFQRLAVGLQAVAQLVQQPVDRPLAHRMAGAPQVLSQPRRTAAVDDRNSGAVETYGQGSEERGVVDQGHLATIREDMLKAR